MSEQEKADRELNTLAVVYLAVIGVMAFLWMTGFAYDFPIYLN